MGTSSGPARLKLAVDLAAIAGQPDRVQARATADLDSGLLKGVTTITARSAVAAIQALDLSALRNSDMPTYCPCPERSRSNNAADTPLATIAAA